MKYITISITSARSHPEQNIKLSDKEELQNTLSKCLEEDDRSENPLYFISFRGKADKDMLKLNFDNTYHTPTGIYTYPLDTLITEK